MLRKIVFQALAVLCLLFSNSLGATTLPLPATWTMYSIGANTYDNYLPFLESQQAAADEFFKSVGLITSTRSCWRLYWGPDRSGPYNDMSWANKKWTPCTVTGAITVSNSDVNVAPPVACTPTSIDTRCFSVGSASNSKNIGAVACSCDGPVAVGNPIDPGTGNKYQAETDFVVPGSPWLNFVRHYNSSTAVAMRPVFGRQWSHSLSYRLTVAANGGVELRRPDGSAKMFFSGAQNPDENGSLTTVVDAGVQTGWLYDSGAGVLESYDMRGRVTRIEFKSGGFLTYAYPSSSVDIPTSVTDHFGRIVKFTYDANTSRVTTVTSPTGAVYTYGYNSGGLLSSVTNPDTSIRRYVMDESANDANTSQTGQLTGITDEAGARFATFKYDKYGRAISTEHAGGAQKFTVSYGNDGLINTVTTPTAAAKQYTFANVLGIMKATGSGTSCSDGSCGQSDVGAFDSHGNRLYVVSESGAKTCFRYDQARNLLLQSVEGLAATDDCATAQASPPASARVTTIEWHADFRKPTTVAGPLLKVVMAYDTSERVLSLLQIPTADANGASGAAAIANGNPRTIGYAYNIFGQPLTITGPKAGAVSSFTYDPAGNMLTATNAAGHATTYANYTGDGRPQSITMPSGAAVALAYDNRGRLKTHTREGETTMLAYNGIGLLTQAALPTGETLTYAYDLAHRLTSVTDSRSQKVTYTLNAAGVATVQQVTNANDSVALSVTRVFDMLGRLTQVTGAQGL